MSHVIPVSGPASGHPRAIAYWLFGVCALVFAMVVLGGATRHILDEGTIPVLMTH